MALYNFSKDNILLAEKIVKTDTFAKKAKGLIGTKHLDDLTTWHFKNCPSVHTFFMSMPIDVVFTDKNLKVTKVVENLAPWRMTAALNFITTKDCYEFAGGALNGKVSVGDKLYVRT